MADMMDMGMPMPPKGIRRRGNAVYFFDDCIAENIYQVKEHLMDIYRDRGNAYAAIIINSPGGTHDTISFYDWLRAYPLPKVTFVEGICASAATAMYLAGDQRFISPSSSFLIHSAYGVYDGSMKEGEIRDELEATRLVNTGMLRKIYTAETKLTKAQLDELLTYREKWLSANECKKFGIAHKVGVYMEGCV